MGHTVSSLNDGVVFGFQYQLAFMKEYLLRLLVSESDSDRAVFLAGHSVGAYVCLQMSESLRRLADRCSTTVVAWA